MSTPKKLSAVLATGVLTASLSAAMAGPALATGGTCGSGYNFLDSYPLDYYDKVGGTLSLHYNPANGKNCAISRVKAAWDGKASQVYVGLSDGSKVVRDPQLDSGVNYHYYAAPVYMYLKNQCVYLWGGLTHGGNTYGADVRGVHCG
ncbi:hypothetical protein [Actinomadura hibisca]|uniref:hypothetical protein n=1 Tax=Actinomadura hibisca TaxID=68565 RepID=UPI00082B38C4|nr:hypothetical protein [Actinomadura hibisca]